MTWEAGCAGTVSERRDSSNPVDDIEVTVTAFGGSLNYDPIDQSNARISHGAVTVAALLPRGPSCGDSSARRQFRDDIPFIRYKHEVEHAVPANGMAWCNLQRPHSLRSAPVHWVAGTLAAGRRASPATAACRPATPPFTTSPPLPRPPSLTVATRGSPRNDGLRDC